MSVTNYFTTFWFDCPKAMYDRLAKVILPDSYLSIISLPCQIFILTQIYHILSHLSSVPGGYACKGVFLLTQWWLVWILSSPIFFQSSVHLSKLNSMKIELFPWLRKLHFRRQRDNNIWLVDWKYNSLAQWQRITYNIRRWISYPKYRALWKWGLFDKGKPNLQL